MLTKRMKTVMRQMIVMTHLAIHRMDHCQLVDHHRCKSTCVVIMYNYADDDACSYQSNLLTLYTFVNYILQFALHKMHKFSFFFW